MSNAATTTTDLTILSPADIDEMWLAAIQPAMKVQAQAAAKFSQANSYERFSSNYAERAAQYRAQGQELLAKANAMYDEASAPFTAEFTRRGGWNRYLLVANAGGHVHKGWSSTCNCHTLRNTTMVAPVPAYSGKDEAEVVAELKFTACTVCFPAAPVETRADRERASAEKREAKAAEREAKRREKLAKAAVRAAKLMVKVEKAYADLGGMDAVLAMPAHGPDSAYGAVSDLQQTVADVILDDVKRARGERPWHTDPRTIIAEAKELGLA